MCETIFRIYRISGIQIWHEYCTAMRIKIHLSNALNYINAVSAGACHRWIWAGWFLFFFIMVLTISIYCSGIILQLVLSSQAGLYFVVVVIIFRTNLWWSDQYIINARLLIAGRRRDSPVGLDLSSGFLQSGVEIASISIGQSSYILDRYVILVETWNKAW